MCNLKGQYTYYYPYNFNKTLHPLLQLLGFLYESSLKLTKKLFMNEIRILFLKM
jgi:hypothetical protein